MAARKQSRNDHAKKEVIVYEFRTFDEGDPDTTITLTHDSRYSPEQLYDLIASETPKAVRDLVSRNEPELYRSGRRTVQTNDVLHEVCDILVKHHGFKYTHVVNFDIDIYLNDLGENDPRDVSIPGNSFAELTKAEGIWYVINHIVWVMLQVWRGTK